MFDSHSVLMQMLEKLRYHDSKDKSESGGIEDKSLIGILNIIIVFYYSHIYI